jgi:hypothetical protein
MPADRLALLREALSMVLDSATLTGESGRIGVFSAASPSKFKWIDVGRLADSRIHAMTNDGFDIAPTEPSFESCDRNAAVVFRAASDFLAGEFAGDADFRVEVHVHLGRDDRVFRGSTADDHPHLSADHPSTAASIRSGRLATCR